MTDDFYPPEWLEQAPPPDFDCDQPKTAALDARLQELELAFCADDGWLRMLMALAADIVSADQVPEFLVSVLRQFRDEQYSCHGRDLTLARLRSNLAHTRLEALEESQ
jgi:hypothetical protein